MVLLIVVVVGTKLFEYYVPQVIFDPTGMIIGDIIGFIVLFLIIYRFEVNSSRPPTDRRE